MVSFSAQNIIDCSRDNYGCDGGLMTNAFQYVVDNQGIETESTYPYMGDDNHGCLYKNGNGLWFVGGYDNVKKGSEKALEDAVKKVGPVSAGIDASNWSFQLYESGIYYEESCSPDELSRGVLVVGYGSDGRNKDFWIVKNSWGPAWGEEGYIRMARNRGNHCGIASMASYPLL